MKKLLILRTMLIAAALIGSAHATVIDLNFTGADVVYSGGTSGDLSIYVANAATFGTTNIAVRITSLNTYQPDTPTKGNGTEDAPPGNNGSVLDDMRIHLDCNTSTRFSFELLNQSTGALFSPADLSYDLLLYDLDGTVATKSGADVFTIFASSFTYIVTASTHLSVVQVAGGGYSFSDKTAGEVAGQDGLTQTQFAASTAQQNISVGLTLHQASWTFEYAVPASDSSGTGRNLLIDPGNLSFTQPTVTTSIPEPAAIGLIGLGGILTLVINRFRRAKA